jgi:hypothetical protein
MGNEARLFLLDFLLSCFFGHSRVCATRLHNRNAACPCNHLARAPAPGPIRCLAHHGCTNSSLRTLRATFSKGVCVAHSSRALLPVSDCSGFAIADYLRFIFALCQAFIRSHWKEKLPESRVELFSVSTEAHNPSPPSYDAGAGYPELFFGPNNPCPPCGRSVLCAYRSTLNSTTAS